MKKEKIIPYIALTSSLLLFFPADGRNRKGPIETLSRNPPSASQTTLQRAKVSAPVPQKAEGPGLPPKIIGLKDGYPMVLIPEGPFIFGADASEREQILRDLSSPDLSLYQTEAGRQTRNIHSYYIDVYEVTNEQYEKFMIETQHRKPRFWKDRNFSNPKQPVVYVGWADAEAYARWAGKRLPNEEEWEKAARGTEGLTWPWGNMPNAENYNGKGQGNWGPVQVGSYPAGRSPFNIMDMAGNVWEMTADIWKDSRHAMRGGSYLNVGAETRTTVRWAAEDEDQGAGWLGFRCVMDTSQLGNFAKPADENLRLKPRR